MTPKEALKEANVVRKYIRVSTEGQEGTLPDQLKTVNEGLRKLGFKGKGFDYAEQASGTSRKRPELLRMMADIEKDVKKGKKPIIVVRDFQRFTRHPRHYGFFTTIPAEQGVRLLSINENQVTGTDALPNPTEDLVVPILVAAGGSEVNIRKVQTKQGERRSREKGIAPGAVPNMFRKEPGPHPLREIRRLVGLGLSGAETARRLGKSTSYIRKNRAKIEKYLLEGGEEALENWYDTIDLFRAFQNEKNEDVLGKKATVRMKTVQRMISGYLADPLAGFPKPTLADLNEYYDNFGLYKKRV